MNRRGELDNQPDGWDRDWNPINLSNLSAYLNPDGGGDSAGNTEGNIDFNVKIKRGWVPNLRGASPVGRDDGGLPCAARSISSGKPS